MDNKVSNAHTIFSPEELTKFKEGFVKYDENKDGRISTEELLKLTESLGEHVTQATQEQVQSVIKSFDTNVDGSLDLDEYITLMANLRAMGQE
ncbi:phospholipid scramblase 1 [Podila horticola]|nr:phospholipid scramblase 1 [Podila horticola]